MLTAQAVAARAGADDDDPVVVDVVAAVNALVNDANGTRWVADESEGADDGATVWAADTYLGALMYAARLVRRANSPAGIEAFFDTGVAYVQRNDPDVAVLLRLGSYAVPMTG